MWMSSPFSCVAVARLGNGEELEGELVGDPREFHLSPLLLIYPPKDDGSEFCQPWSLDKVDVQMKGGSVRGGIQPHHHG